MLYTPDQVWVTVEGIRYAAQSELFLEKFEVLTMSRQSVVMSDSELPHMLREGDQGTCRLGPDSKYPTDLFRANQRRFVIFRDAEGELWAKLCQGRQLFTRNVIPADDCTLNYFRDNFVVASVDVREGR